MNSVAMIELLQKNPTLWDLYTRKEEYSAQVLDQYRRFPYSQSRHRDVFHPAVSEFLIKRGWPVHYPDDRPFAVCLTHDIDTVRYNIWHWPYETAMALHRGHPGSALRIFGHRLSRKINPIWNFAHIMDLEAKYGAKSSFYFLALEKGEEDFNFRIESLRDELRHIAARGWEVGLHGGHRAATDKTALCREKDRLEMAVGREVVGYRSHYLRFTVPATWNLLADAGFAYDATFGYADCAGFRNGMCHPFRPVDLDRQQPIEILEIPLIVMDCTLDGYMRLDRAQSWELVRRLVDTVERYRGVFTILWHNTYMLDEMLDFYEKILDYCLRKNAWMTTGSEIASWWKKNNFAELDVP
jgi:peptidoglycan/xylan/chitin deacetylase (PgdA/CDA1 family)